MRRQPSVCVWVFGVSLICVTTTCLGDGPTTKPSEVVWLEALVKPDGMQYFGLSKLTDQAHPEEQGAFIAKVQNAELKNQVGSMLKHVQAEQLRRVSQRDESAKKTPRLLK
jgi:hypothetical protein